MSVLRMSPEQYAEHLARTRAARAAQVPTPSQDVASGTAAVSEAPKRLSAKEKVQALGRLKAGEMNKTEARYSAHLGERLANGEIAWFKFEGIKFRLADNTFYTPDFAVMLADGHMEAHEVKGYMEEDANVKIKVAAALYPFAFLLVRVKPKKAGGGWDIKGVGNGA